MPPAVTDRTPAAAAAPAAQPDPSEAPQTGGDAPRGRDADLLDTSASSNPAIRYALEQEQRAKARLRGNADAAEPAAGPAAAASGPRAETADASPEAPPPDQASRASTASASPDPKATAPPSSSAAPSASTPRSQSAAAAATPSGGEPGAAATESKEVAPAGPVVGDRPWLDTAPAKEIGSHPRVAGIVGDLAHKQAKEQLEAWKAEYLQSLETQRLQQAADEDDLVTLGEAKKAELAALRDQTERQQAEQTRLQAELQQTQSAFTKVQDTIADYATKALPPSVLAKATEGVDFASLPFEQGVRTWLEKVVDAAVSHKLAEAVDARLEQERPKLRQQVEDELRPALRAEILGDAGDNEPTPNLDKSGVPVRRPNAWERLQSATTIEELNALVDDTPTDVWAAIERSKQHAARQGRPAMRVS